MVNWFLKLFDKWYFFVVEKRYLVDNLLVGRIKVLLFDLMLFVLNNVMVDCFVVFIIIVLYLVVNLW